MKSFLSRDIIPMIFPTLENEVRGFDNNSSFPFRKIIDFQKLLKVLCLTWTESLSSRGDYCRSHRRYTLQGSQTEKILEARPAPRDGGRPGVVTTPFGLLRGGKPFSSTLLGPGLGPCKLDRRKAD